VSLGSSADRLPAPAKAGIGVESVGETACMALAAPDCQHTSSRCVQSQPQREFLLAGLPRRVFLQSVQ
jgi:hypothetical protein